MLRAQVCGGGGLAARALPTLALWAGSLLHFAVCAVALRRHWHQGAAGVALAAAAFGFDNAVLACGTCLTRVARVSRIAYYTAATNDPDSNTNEQGNKPGLQTST